MSTTDDGAVLVVVVAAGAVIGAAALLAVAVLAPLLALTVQSAAGGPLCGKLPIESPLSSGDTLTAEQAANATTIVATALRLGAGQQGSVIAVIAAIAESSLVNLDHGLADSLGLFQQRASQGWGTPAAELDPVQATTMFVDHLEAIPGWTSLDPGVAAQTVQQSAYPGRYDMQLSEGQAIVADLVGDGTCSRSTTGYVNPFAVGSWSPSRTDQGVDWLPLTPSPVVAIGDATVTFSSSSTGWPGGACVVYVLAAGSHAGLPVYVCEHLVNLVPVGTVVKAGDTIATALPGYPWIEMGWSAGPTSDSPASPYNGAPGGTPTASGLEMARFLIELGAPVSQDPGPGPDRP